MLTDKEKERITLEEIFRQEVREELETNKPKTSKKEKAWVLLNSSFSLWLLSTVVVGLATLIYTNIKTNADNNYRRNETSRQLNLEIAGRLQNAVAYITGLEKDVSGKTSYLEKGEIASRVLGYLNINKEDYINKEYSIRNFPSLLYELQSLTDKDKSREIKQAINGYKKLQQFSISEGKYYAFGPTISDTDLKRVLGWIKEIKEIVNNELLLEQWKQ